MSKARDSLTFISGVILGAAVGGLMGVLFAPDKGEITRKKIAKKGKKVLKDIEDEVKEAKKKLEPKLEAVKKEVGKRVGEIKTGFEQGIKAYKRD